ncbi:MAG: ABC transporter ATP-binding protein [Myxococcota bacterium]
MTPGLLDLARPRVPHLVLSGVLAILAALLELAPHLGVYLVARLALLPDATGPGTVEIVGFVAFALVVRYLALGGSVVLSHAAAFHILRRLREALLAKLGRVSTGDLLDRSPGDLKKAVVDDVSGLEDAIAHQIPDAASALLVPTLGFLALLYVDWPMALLSISLVPVAFVVQASFMWNMGELFERWHTAEKTANEAILEFVRGVVVLKAFDREASSMDRVRGGVRGLVDLATSMTRGSVVGYAAFMVLLASNLAVIVPAGIWRVQSGTLSAPDLVLFVVVGMGLTQPLLKLLFLFGGLQHNGHRLQRVRGVLSMPDEPRRDFDTPLVSAEHGVAIAVEGVTFAYGADRGAVLRDVSFDIAPGTVTALVGRSGSGKSTLARLLRGAYPLDAGTIRLGGRDLAGLSRATLNQAITVIDQHTHLFSGSVADNLRLARPDATDDALWSALDAAAVADVVEALPGGLDAPLGELGRGLSGGERQRLAIARAVLRDAPVLVLDEVTAHLDPQSAHAVQRGLSRLLTGRTVVVIAHRLRSVADADRIVVLEAGAVAGVGRHAELRETSPPYRALWEAQEQAEGWMLTRDAVIGGAS